MLKVIKIQKKGCRVYTACLTLIYLPSRSLLQNDFVKIDSKLYVFLTILHTICILYKHKYHRVCLPKLNFLLLRVKGNSVCVVYWCM